MALAGGGWGRAGVFQHAGDGGDQGFAGVGYGSLNRAAIAEGGGQLQAVAEPGPVVEFDDDLVTIRRGPKDPADSTSTVRDVTK